jgi:signal transduction histidine kinase
MSLPTFNIKQTERKEPEFTFFVWDFKNKVVLDSGSPSLIPVGASRDNVEMHYANIIDKVDSAFDHTIKCLQFDFCLDRQQQSWVNVQACPTSDTPPSDKVMVSLTDISHHKQQVDQLKNKYNEVLNLAKMIIHDVKNPLMTILNVGRLLDMEVRNENSKSNKSYTELIEQIAKNALRMADKTGHLITYISDKNSTEQTRILLAEELQVFVAEIKNKYSDRIIEADISGPAIHAEVKSARIHIRTILEELLSNALKYSEPEQKIIFSLDKDEQHLVLTCTDHGIGIPSLQASTLLQKLPTTSRPGLRDEKGFGLGLPIIKKLIENMSGHLKLESEEDEGTTVTVCFPLA